MEVLSPLQPRAVFHYFEELCAIPHGSGNTKAVSGWCAAFAQARGLEYHQDALNNIIIIKEAAPGYEGAEPVILQGHLDMVCEKEPGCPKDLEREGLDLEVDGDFVTARGTTLGGDDGIAVAMALALLDAQDIPHPRLEVVLTVDEEVGMLGAAALDASPLRGRTLINLDSEEEGVFTVSCAGGNRTECVLPVKREPFAGTRMTISMGGLTGGHSGTEIHRGRANANVLLGRCLRAVSARTELRLGEAAGGSKDNAIPTESRAQIVVSDEAAARAALRELEANLRREYRTTDPELFLRAEPSQWEGSPMDQASTERAVIPGFYGAMPDGKIKTFSRGGSDITGSIVAGAVHADLYENWTDVSGFLVADPRIVENPKEIDVITYRELRELSYMGATVLHEDAIFPVRREGIPINIRNTNAPEDKGTLIVEATCQKPRFIITGIAGKKDFAAVTVEKAMMNSEVGFCRKVLQVFEENGISIEHMPSGIDTMSVFVHQDELKEMEQKVIAGIHREVEPDVLELESDLALVAVVGRGMRTTRGTSGRIFSALAHANIEVKMIDQGSSGLNVIIGVPNDDFEAAVKAIYDIFVTTQL